MERAVYMDYNATAPMRPAVVAAVAEALGLTGNPSSVHRFGRLARRRLEEAREQVAALVGARPDQVVFTGGGTEANNLALTGSGRGRRIVSAIEHESVANAAPDAETVPVTPDGAIDLAALDALLARAGPPALLSVMLANNETGVIQPVAAAAAAARRAGALVHCDAVQAAGRIPVDFAALGVDLLSLSAHKLGGPPGSGALIVADGVALIPLLRGGGQERGRRAGTENVAGAVGMAKALELAYEEFDSRNALYRSLRDKLLARAELAAQGHLARLRDALEARLRATVPAATVFGAAAARLPNTSCFALPGLPAATQVMALDLAGIAVSAGAACSSGKVRPSRVLRAMGVSEDAAGSAIRVSLGWRTADADIDRLVEAWSALAARPPAVAAPAA